MSMRTVLKAKLFKSSQGFYLQELPKKGSGGAQCEMTIGSTWGEGDKLSPKNCHAVEFGYDLYKLARERIYDNTFKSENVEVGIDGVLQYVFKLGCESMIELLADKRFSEENIHHVIDIAVQWALQTKGVGETYQEMSQRIIQSLQQNEWDVEIEMEYYDPLPPTRQSALRPKLDPDGCLILKRV